MIGFKTYIKEGTSLGSGELAKPNSKTGEPRTEILARLIKSKTPLELVKGGTVVIGDVESALSAIDHYKKNPTNFAMLDTKGQPVKLSALKKSKEFGGGISGAGGGTKQTAIAESAQCVWCAAMLQHGISNPIEFYTDEILSASFKEVKVGKTSLKEVLGIDDAWKNSSFLTAQILIKEGYIHKGMTFHRDSSLMNAIYKAKDEAFKNNGFAKFTNDKWNPGDIWAVDPSFNIKSINTESVSSLQKSILEHFVDRSCVSISLKKVVKSAKTKEYNVNLPPDTDDYKLISAEAKSTKSGRGTIWTTKRGIIVFDSGSLTIKDNSSFGSIKMEIEGKTARGGGAGWGYIMDAASMVFGKKLPPTGRIKQLATRVEKGDERALKWFYQLVTSVEPNITYEEYLQEVKQKDGAWIHAKIGALYIIGLLKANGGTKANRFITKIINYAGSKTEDSSAYVKVYE